ncbi:uncharacterized protein LOC130710748 [Lotus japonicus]|uniref:uncharacterized protein LOC130710748 n=1 Tax=Lotus japonicus TaxID=34305 RepID=UPI00258F97F0|nr:uncharacterized protein LOC130710748 [Lotus japonicus]
MLNKHYFEALDITLNDLMKTRLNFGYDKPFGGKVLVFRGDFRQILHVVPKCSRADIIESSINSSYLWNSCKVLKLTKNMRLQNSASSSTNEETREFAEWILQVGDGTVNTIDDAQTIIEISPYLLIEKSDGHILSLVSFAYPKMIANMKNHSFFEERANLAPTLESVEHVNNFMSSMIPGDEKKYLSFDTTCKSDEDKEIEGDWFTPEFLNEVKCSGIPNHKLNLKVGIPIMLLRNIDQSIGLCNRTRLIVTDLTKKCHCNINSKR